MEYSAGELAILQALLDVYRDMPEVPLLGMTMRFRESHEVEAARSLKAKGVAETRCYRGDPIGSINVGVNKAGADEMARLFNVGVLTKFEEREPAKTD